MSILGKILGDNNGAEQMDIKTTEDEKRITGKIIKISKDGWGFITSKEIPFTRIFFHWTSLKQDTLRFTELAKNMSVEFTPVEIPEHGWRALQIIILDKKE